MNRLSPAGARGIEPFRVMKILERAQQLEAAGAHVIHMEIGEPDVAPPASVLAAAQTALVQGNTRYTHSLGLPELREAIAAWYRRVYGVAVDPVRVLITPGSSGAFIALYAALLAPGEGVLIPDPGYPGQRNFARTVGINPIAVPVDATTNWQLAPEHVQRFWREDVRAAVVINPGNPTGVLAPKEQIRALAEAVRAKGGVLVVDEIYQQLVYGEESFTALAVSDEIVVVDGFSKRWAMTGFRIGWMVVPEWLIEPCRRVMQNIFVAAPTVAQHAALAALDADAELEKMRRAYDARRKLLLAELPRLGFEVAVQPKGAFYIYARLPEPWDDAARFCAALLEEAHVATTPGEDFGAHDTRRHLRFSYATGLDDIRTGLDRMKTWLASKKG